MLKEIKHYLCYHYYIISNNFGKSVYIRKNERLYFLIDNFKFIYSTVTFFYQTSHFNLPKSGGSHSKAKHSLVATLICVWKWTTRFGGGISLEVLRSGRLAVSADIILTGLLMVYRRSAPHIPGTMRDLADRFNHKSPNKTTLTPKPV